MHTLVVLRHAEQPSKSSPRHAGYDPSGKICPLARACINEFPFRKELKWLATQVALETSWVADLHFPTVCPSGQAIEEAHVWRKLSFPGKVEAQSDG